MCPQCGKEPTVVAMHGRLKILMCLGCGQGWKSLVPKGNSYTSEVIIDFACMLQEVIVNIGKRKVKLAPIPSQNALTLNNKDSSM